MATFTFWPCLLVAIFTKWTSLLVAFLIFYFSYFGFLYWLEFYNLIPLVLAFCFMAFFSFWHSLIVTTFTGRTYLLMFACIGWPCLLLHYLYRMTVTTTACIYWLTKFTTASLYYCLEINKPCLQMFATTC